MSRVITVLFVTIFLIVGFFSVASYARAQVDHPDSQCDWGYDPNTNACRPDPNIQQPQNQNPFPEEAPTVGQPDTKTDQPSSNPFWSSDFPNWINPFRWSPNQQDNQLSPTPGTGSCASNESYDNGVCYTTKLTQAPKPLTSQGGQNDSWNWDNRPAFLFWGPTATPLPCTPDNWTSDCYAILQLTPTAPPFWKSWFDSGR